MSIDLSKVTDVVVEDIDFKDYPDFCDAHIASALIDGRPATDDELDELNEDSSFVRECLEKQLY